MNISYTFKAIGTTWNIRLALPLAAHGFGTRNEKESADTSASAVRLERLILARIDEFDKAYSRFRTDSTVSMMAREAGTYELPPDAKLLMETYRTLYDLSDGLVTPLMGKVLTDAGYDREYSLVPKQSVEPAPAWDESVKYSSPRITIAKPTAFDFGAIGKGYIIDLVGELLESEGVSEYLIDAGGDIRHRTAAADGKVTVGLENPEDARQVIGVAKIRNASICGSAGNRRRWATYTHIINPKTATSPKNLRAVWALADSTRIADALTTALYFVPIHVLQQHFAFEYAILYETGAVEWSARFPGEFFTS